MVSLDGEEGALQEVREVFGGEVDGEQLPAEYGPF